MIKPIYIFPYKVSLDGVINEGILYPVPKFCKLNCKNKTCLDFYHNECLELGIKICPYGFAVDVIEIQGNLIIFSCLNLEGYANKKEIQKRLNKKDFLPRVPISLYKKSKSSIIDIVNTSKDYYDNANKNYISKDEYLNKTEMLNNSFHELRKLNQHLKSQTENLIRISDEFKWDQDYIYKIQQISQNIFSSSQLMTIRLNTYDFGVNPTLLLNNNKEPIQIHNKFTKAVHCLSSFANQRNLRINTNGISYCEIMANQVLEILPYLFLDNAIKYSLPNRNIDIFFEEKDNILDVYIKSFSLRPHGSELKRLTDRNFRSSRSKSFSGQGIGLYLANIICTSQNIDLNIKIGEDKNKYYFEDNPYSDFIVDLTFHDIIKVYEDD